MEKEPIKNVDRSMAEFKLTDIEGIRLLSINDVMNCVVGLGRERILMQLRNKVRENISEYTSQPLCGKGLYKSVEDVRNDFEKETGKRWMVVPVSHGENGYASWDYQLWLEGNLCNQSPTVQTGEKMYTENQVLQCTATNFQQ